MDRKNLFLKHNMYFNDRKTEKYYHVYAALHKSIPAQVHTSTSVLYLFFSKRFDKSSQKIHTHVSQSTHKVSKQINNVLCILKLLHCYKIQNISCYTKPNLLFDRQNILQVQCAVEIARVIRFLSILQLHFIPSFRL